MLLKVVNITCCTYLLVHIWHTPAECDLHELGILVVSRIWMRITHQLVVKSENYIC